MKILHEFSGAQNYDVEFNDTMKKIYSEKLVRVLKNKKRLEKVLNVQIENRGREVSIEGTPEDEYLAEKVIDALNFGFPFSEALAIRTEDALLEIINIKEHTKRADLPSVRARIIGKDGKTLKTLSTLTKCALEIKDNEVGIIGAPELIQNAQEAIIHLVKGSKQANVYKLLEKRQVMPVTDLGLKETKKK